MSTAGNALFVCGLNSPDWKNVVLEKVYLNHERSDIMAFWENSTTSLLLRYVYIDIQGNFFILERFCSISISFIFPHPNNVHGAWESKQVLPLPRKPLGRIVNGLYFLPDKVFFN